MLQNMSYNKIEFFYSTSCSITVVFLRLLRMLVSKKKVKG
jgi:hypothetical protein